MASQMSSLHSATPSLSCLRPVFWGTHPSETSLISEPEIQPDGSQTSISWGGWCPAGEPQTHLRSH